MFLSSRLLKKAKDRLLTRAAQKHTCVFETNYRAGTVRERSPRRLFQHPAIRGITVVAVSLALSLSGCSMGKFPVRTYRMGEKVSLGPFVYTVYETQWLTQMGAEPGLRVPQHRFFLVRASVMNSGSTELAAPNVSIVDDSGKIYEELVNGESVPEWIGYLRQLKPSESAQGNLVFDVPPRHYKLRALDDTGDRMALIDIPLSFDAESPQLINPGEIRKK
jgi:uncharacterized protein DUF4352